MIKTTTYYNEFDPKAAAWLRVLIAHNLIPPGTVDERPIQSVKSEDLKSFTQCHFFAGVGGWAYALRLAGIPDYLPLWTGSCPCQPFSVAGQGKGINDDRHLWPYLASLIEQSKPEHVFGEQVASKAGRSWLAGVQIDVERMGFILGAQDTCSAGVNAPNIRQRLYWVACAAGLRRDRGGSGPKAKDRPPDQGQNFPRSLQSGIEGRCAVGGGLADTEHPKRGTEYQVNADPHGRNGPGGGSYVGGLGNSGSKGFSQRIGDRRLQRKALESPPGQAAQCGSEPSGLGDSKSRRKGTISEGSCERLLQHDGSSAIRNNFWQSSTWHPCSDGKIRRIPEPGFLRLATGIPFSLDDLCSYSDETVSALQKAALQAALTGFPLCPALYGRVPMLKGFGNAINPVLAAEFIGAYFDLINTQAPTKIKRKRSRAIGDPNVPAGTGYYES